MYYRNSGANNNAYIVILNFKTQVGIIKNTPRKLLESAMLQKYYNIPDTEFLSPLFIIAADIGQNRIA